MKKQSVGGQAVIEGVMMQSKERRAIAVRKTDGDITIKKETIKSWVRDRKLDKVPFLRGGLIMIETMIEGVKSLNYSSEVFLGEEGEEDDKFDIYIKKIFKDKANDVIIFLSMAIAMVLSVGLFVIIPTLTGGLFANIVKNDIILNLIEGMIRICILFTYIVLVSKSKDIERVFQYHGAEHKSIHCYENDEELTVENARKYKRLHPRCGTNFLFIVMATSIILFSFFGWPNPIVRIGVRIICIPVVSGIAYEIIRMLGKYDNKITRIVAYPGMMLQYFTTKDPDDEQLEVALESLKTVLNEEKREIL